jgi:hypothetical protein
MALQSLSRLSTTSTLEVSPSEAPQPLPTKQLSHDVESDELRDKFLHWQYMGRKNWMAEAALALPYAPFIAVGIGPLMLAAAIKQRRTVPKPSSLRKHCFNLTDVVSTPKHSELLIGQLKAHGVLRKHSRARKIVGLHKLDDVLPKLVLDGKPLSEAQQAGVRCVLLAHQSELERRAARQAEISDLSQRIAEQKRDFKQRYGGNADKLLSDNREYNKLGTMLRAAHKALTAPTDVANVPVR